jgi:nitrite reductase/ring-hydroxylating ferredoxin subunit
MLTIDKDEVQEGKMRGYQMDGLPVLVAKVDGKTYAIKNRCTHLGCRLSEGQLEGLIVTCPCHGSKFDISNGKVVQYVGKWPRLLQRGVGLIMRDEEVFDVKTNTGTLEISRRKS